MHQVNIEKEIAFKPRRRLNVPIRRQHLRSALTLDNVFTTNLYHKRSPHDMAGVPKQIIYLRVLAGFLGQITYLPFKYLLLLF